MLLSPTALLAYLFQLYLFILTMRFALHLARTDFYNPLVQIIIKLTDWLIAPLQKLVRPGRYVDAATVIAAVLFGALTTAVLFWLSIGQVVVFPRLVAIFIGAGALGAAYSLLNVYFLGLIALAIMSWIAPRPTHPAPLLIIQITRPILAPVQRFVPPIGGVIDLSPMIVLFAIWLIKSAVLLPLAINVLQFYPGFISGFQ